MGFDDFAYCCSAVGQMGHNAEAVSHAIGKLSTALGACSHAEGYNSLAYRQPIKKKISNVICASIVRKPLIKIDEIKNATITIDNAKIDWDILEKNFGRNRLWTIEED